MVNKDVYIYSSVRFYLVTSYCSRHRCRAIGSTSVY